jgi:hypothetical protein
MSILFWPLLILPGFVVVRRYFPSEMESGILGVVSISYLATFAILAPPLIVLYLINAPLALFSALIVIAILVALAETTRRGYWRELGRLCLTAVSIELLILALDLLLSQRIGAFMSGDAQVHLTRIRHILDHGLNNYDPFVLPATYFFPIYHTNLLHALYASASQLTGLSHLDVWCDSLPWGQLLVTSGCYYLTWTIFEDRRAAWLAAMLVIANRGAVNFVVYPNQLAPYWLWPLLLAFVIRACKAIPPEKHTARAGDSILAKTLPIAAASLVMGMTHALYVVFAGITALPLLAVILILRIRRRSPQRNLIILCMLALSAGLPFALASKLMSRSEAPTGTPTESSTAQAAGDSYIHLPNSTLVMRDPRSLPNVIGGSKIGSLIFLIGLIAAWFSRHRRPAFLLAAVSLITLLILFIPYLCTPLLRILGEEWVLGRFEIILTLVFISLAVPALGMQLLRLFPRKQESSIVGAALSILTLAAGYALSSYESPWTWKETLTLASRDSQERRNDLAVCHDLQQFARKNIPPGRVVLIHPITGRFLTAVHDVRLVASASASNGVPDLTQRLTDLAQMLSIPTPWDQRRALLKKYSVEYFFPTPDAPADWATGHLRDVRQSDHFSLLLLQTSP